MPKVAEEMRQWSDLLLAEVQPWKSVAARPMFGMTGLYRAARIFGALPRTRAIGTAYSIAFKLPRAAAFERELDSDERIIRERPGARWISFELTSGRDTADALLWLRRAYDQAGNKTS